MERAKDNNVRKTGREKKVKDEGQEARKRQRRRKYHERKGEREEDLICLLIRKES